MRRKHFGFRYILISITIVLIVILAIFSYTLKTDRELNVFESLIKDSVIGASRIITLPFRYIGDIINDFNDGDIRKKYNELLANTDRIDSLNAENVELRKQLDAMKEELDIKYTINEYSFLNAAVITRNVASWYNTITINKGSYNGVEAGMAVVNNKGLVGRVISVTTFNSEVKLLSTSDMNNKISVAVNHDKKKVYGLIRNYNYDNNYFEVEGISNTEKISIDDIVYTSGLGGVIPSGILIGKVKEITTDEYDLAKILKIEPAVSFNDINYVAVLKRKDKWFVLYM